MRNLTQRWKKQGRVLAEKGGLDVVLEPDGVLGSGWKAGAWRLKREEPLLETPCVEDELWDWILLYWWWDSGCGMVRGGGRGRVSAWDASGPWRWGCEFSEWA